MQFETEKLTTRRQLGGGRRRIRKGGRRKGGGGGGGEDGSEREAAYLCDGDKIILPLEEEGWGRGC